MRIKRVKAIAIFCLLGCGVIFASADEENVVLESNNYAWNAQAGILTMDGFATGGSPGNPQLPQRSVNWALPPEAQMDSVTLEIRSVDAEELDGTFDLPPAPPMMTFDTNGSPVISWGETPADRILNGRNTAVYSKNAFYPVLPVQLLPYGQLRKWQFARIVFSPMQYNPVTRRLRLVRRIEVVLHYQVESSFNSVAFDAPAVWRDSKMKDRAAEILDNFDSVSSMYEPYVTAAPTDGGTGADFVIITTTAITNGVVQLPNLVQHLERSGHSVQVVTENDYGGLSGQSPNGTAEKIRQWLINNYASLGIEYVLLIGSPDPDDPSDASDSVGDIPMKMCWPRYSESSYRETPTDYFYADLTGNWDLDGDGYYGEYNGDGGFGGVDFAAEVFVGRIPVYDGNYSDTDTIISRLIDYETDAGDLSWRKRMLLPMAMSNYANEDYDGSDRTDGRALPEEMIDNVLSPNGCSFYVMYEKEGLSPVPDSAAYDNSSHAGISMANLNARWNEGYGMLFWWGHGSENSVARKIWDTDDGDGVPEPSSDETISTTLASSYTMNQITSACPALIYMSSCNCGYPENWNNLSYAALRDNAVASIAASRVSWYSVGTWADSLSRADNSEIGYQTMKNLVDGGHCYGQALYNAKNDIGNGWDAEAWMNKMDFNLYGLPTLTLTNVISSVPEITVSVADPIRSETNLSPIEYVITSSETVTGAFSVAYYIYGTAEYGQDYTTATASVTFPAGTNACSFFVYPTDDAVAEGAESVVFSLLVNTNYSRGYPFSAFVNIMDDETPLAMPHSPVISDDPSGQNNPGEAMDFDLSGGSLASLDQGGFGSFGRVYLNYDETNLYIGGFYSHPGGNDDVLALFLSVTSLTDNAVNLWSCGGPPYALEYLHNVAFEPAADIAILLGDEWGDGTFPNFNIETGTDLGQGVFYLNSVFTPVTGARLSQFDGDGTNAVATADDDGNRQAEAWEVAIPLSSLNAMSVFSLGEIYISGVPASQSTDGDDRYLSGNYLGAGAACSAGLNDIGNYAYGFVNLTGALVQAYAPNQLPSVMILSPHAGAEYVQGQSIPFQASATDAEDGVLTNILWTSSLDGIFAQGESAALASLSVGEQNIIASVEDSEPSAGSNAVTIFIAADVQTNGLPDSWEEQYWGVSGTSSAEEDSDSDGMSNGDEWLAGTSPTDDASLFTADMQVGETDDDIFLLQWPVLSNRTYSIWVLTNLLDSIALPLVTNLYPAYSGTAFYTNNVQQTDAKLYYRIKVEH